MKQFTYKLILALVPIIAIATLLEIALRKIPNDYSYKNDFLQNRSQDIEVLILGNSHAYYGIDPSYFSLPAFNASHVSQSVDLDKQLLELYLDKSKNLKQVIVTTDYLTLFFRMSLSPESWRTKNYAIYYGLPVATKPEQYTELFSLSLKTNLARVCGFYFGTEEYITCNQSGYSPNAHMQLKDIAKAGKNAAIRHTVQDTLLFQKNLAVIESMIEKCNKRNIQVLCITCPASSYYQDNIDPLQLQKTEQTMYLLAKKYKNCTYQNYWHSSLFTDDDFADGDHLNPQGAQKLSESLAKTLEISHLDSSSASQMVNLIN